MPPYQSYLVYGLILNSDGIISPNASIEVATSVGRKYYESDVNGAFLFELADIGYSAGEQVQMNITDKFNNQFKNHTFIVSGQFHQEDITLSLRMDAVNASDLAPKSILHSVGKKPITLDNPLPIQSTSNPEIDLVNNPSHAWNYTRSDGQPDSEDVTIKGITYRRTFTYNDTGFITARSGWVKQ